MIKNAIFLLFLLFKWTNLSNLSLKPLNLSDVKSQFPSARLSLIFI